MLMCLFTIAVISSFVFNSVLCSVIPIHISPQVTVQEGVLEGRLALDKDGRIYYSFQGIPYAKPPLLDLRFKAPQNPVPWEGVRSAKNEGNRCPQIRFEQYHGEEDCLFLNVYTPELPQTLGTDKSLLPVMVWIHGGSYTENSGDEELLGPQYLVAKDVILVTINYRLGALGFLSLEDSSLRIPGNAGLKDQVAALKWIKRNIRAFGGDPDNVTIFGNSAGASSVQLQILSPMSQGLFKRAASHSGVALAFWALTDDKTFGNKLAETLGYNVTTDEDVLNALMNCTDHVIVLATTLMKNSFTEAVGPVIEVPSNEYIEEHFLTKHPEDIIRENSYINVPFLIGHTSFEMIFLQKYYELNPHHIPNREIIDKSISENANVNSIKLKDITQRIFDHYYGKEGPSLVKWLTAMSDLAFVYPVHRTLKLMSNYTQPIYFYKFALDSDLNIGKILFNATLPGASHMDDNGYLFQFQGAPELIPGEKAALGVERETTLWTNFAKTGDPQGYPPITRWPTVQHNSPNLEYLEIGDELVVKQNPDVENVKFWEELYQIDGNSEYIYEIFKIL